MAPTTRSAQEGAAAGAPEGPTEPAREAGGGVFSADSLMVAAQLAGQGPAGAVPQEQEQQEMPTMDSPEEAGNTTH